VPGGQRNKLLEGILGNEVAKNGVVSIYAPDDDLSAFCRTRSIPYQNLGFAKKTFVKQTIDLFIFIRKVRPKIVYLHSFYPSAMGLALCFLQRKVISVPVRHHNQVFHLSRNRKGIFVDKLVNFALPHIVAVSESVKRTMIKEGCSAKKIHVIQNGMNTPARSKNQEPLHNDEFQLKILAIGRIDWQKNYEGMFEVVRNLKEKQVAFTLNILGTGDEAYRQELLELANSFSIEKNVSWLGWREDVPGWIAASDVLLHTAKDEACPLVLIEALQSGIPIVSTNAGGCAEVLNSFYEGIEPLDQNKFTDELLKMKSDLNAANEYARSIIEAAQAEFSVDKMHSQYMLLSEFLSRR
jgi:glycosyltransferase involved in cell wall biosynthesis